MFCFLTFFFFFMFITLQLVCSEESTAVTYVPETTQVEPIPDIDFVTDWDCNYYSSYTTGVCYNLYTSQYYFECNGTDKLSFYIYSDGSCGTNSASPSFVITYDESSDTADLFECDNDDPCEYIILRYYDDEDCSGDSYADGGLIPGVCYSLSSTSYGVACKGSELTVVTFTDEDDCTGDAVASTIDYEDYNDDFSGCYEVCMPKKKSTFKKRMIMCFVVLKLVVCLDHINCDLLLFLLLFFYQCLNFDVGYL